jgi:hypothetical protein
MKTIVSFGDSFIFGSELQDNFNGDKAWPGLIAKNLGHQYRTLAVPGCGNEAIARQVFTYFSSSPTQDTLAVINWTWCMRWDFYLSNLNEWITLGPTCVPDKLKNLLNIEDSQELINFYRKHIADVHSWNRLKSLQAIFATQSFLKNHNIKNIQTYIDRELFMPSPPRPRIEHYNAFKDPSWPEIKSEDEISTLPDLIKNEVDQDYFWFMAPKTDPEYVQILQKITRTELQDFQGQTFLEWSRFHGYEVTPLPGDHPLEQAHTEAANLWQSKYHQLLQ